MTRLIAAALLPVLMLACAHAGGEPAESVDLEPDVPGTSATDTVIGVPAHVGAHPFVRTMLRVEDGAQIRLSGPLTEEIGRAAGARVRAWGRLIKQDGAELTLEAQGYRVLSADGEPVLDGVLVSGPHGPCLDVGGDRCVLAEGFPDLPAGSRLWIQRSPEGIVLRYGVLREGAR